MPKIKNIKKVLILGSGGLKIGQAGEFDYSGSQAIKALKEEHVEVVLLNPNIATVQTDLDLADKIYFLPVTTRFAAEIIKKEKVDSVLLGFGGQTALNVGLDLEAKGILKKYNVGVIGTPTDAIRNTEDRGLFIKKLNEVKIKTTTGTEVDNLKNALLFIKQTGYPVMLRSSFVLGGANSDVARNKIELKRKLKKILRTSPKVLIEEYLEGWKEIEYEMIRDRYDNCIAVCNMENLDPMGIHTGDSIVVAPSQTLSNYEYHFLREVAIKAVRHLKIIGECNIQYALNPKNSDYKVIEINARLSRSSALASKATGYPLAYIAGKLALGYSLTELTNSATKVTQAFFEPALDYLALKIPRWDFNKFPAPDKTISSEMKSVGEVMAIGRKFEEVLQKALRMLAIGAEGLVAQGNDNFRIKNYLEEIKHPTDKRVFAIAEALGKGVSIKDLNRLSFIDTWFLEKIKNIVDLEARIKRKKLGPELLRSAKQFGFSDKQIGIIKKIPEEKVRALRKKFRITPAIKQIDTLAGEFYANTNYLYTTYNGDVNDVQKSARPIIILGSGPYSIGSSVEFDWCCVQATKAVKALGYKTIIINCNPETVSTDFDITDRLYFEETSLERILDICEFEKPQGVILSTGGQIPNNLALRLHKRNVKILGTHPENIASAEDRNKFSALLDKLHIDQPAWISATNIEKSKKAARKLGYPVLVRPSYVLSGTAMNVVFSENDLKKYLRKAANVSPEHPVVISKFIENAKEIEVDGVAQRGRIVTRVISEHIENAGTHSGDATIVIPPQRIFSKTEELINNSTESIVKSLRINGPFNIQFIAKDNEVKVIECNLRASRTFPFISKATKNNLIEIAINAINNKSLKYLPFEKLNYVVVKSPQFSYGRIKNADPLGYVEMASTGEVACFGDTYLEALLKSMLSSDFRYPKKNIFVSIEKEEDRIKLLPYLKKLEDMNFAIFTDQKLLSQKKMDLIISIPANHLIREFNTGYALRRFAVDMEIPLISNPRIAQDFINALYAHKIEDLKVKQWKEYN